MNNYYYTFGTAKHFPFSKYDFVKVTAENALAADEMFRSIYPDNTPGIINCAFVYEENEFEKIKNKYYKNQLPANELLCIPEINISIQTENKEPNILEGNDEER